MTRLFKCPEPRDPRQITHSPADTILDHLIHITHRIELTGESLRRGRGKQANKT